MFFITVTSKDKIREFISKEVFEDNRVFDFTDDSVTEIGNALEDLTGLSCNPVVGVTYNDSVSLANRWRSLVRILPIKAGEVVLQFNVKEDEIMYMKLTDLMTNLYGSSNKSFESLLSHYPSGSQDISFTVPLKFENFDCGYVVEPDFGKGNLNNSETLFNDIKQLKTISDVNVFDKVK